jgi:hypothetical protein
LNFQAGHCAKPSTPDEQGCFQGQYDSAIKLLSGSHETKKLPGFALESMQQKEAFGSDPPFGSVKSEHGPPTKPQLSKLTAGKAKSMDATARRNGFAQTCMFTQQTQFVSQCIE